MTLETNGSTVIINGEVIAVAKKPKYKRGKQKVKSNISLIGTQTVVTQSQDFSEAVGEVTITLRHTPQNRERIEGWQDNIGKNAIRLIDNENGFTVTFSQMSVEEDPEHDFDTDEVEIVFKGGQGR